MGQPIKVEDGAGNTLDKLALLDRGYTGHEHLLSVGLIHMNGRLYDPVLHRFLQPDNFVQDPFNTQNFNRYGYCLNNPLVYVDQNGEFWHLVIAAVVGGVINLTMNAIQGNVKSFGEGLAYFGTGALSGLASSVNPLLGGAVLGLGNNITTQVSYNGWSNINWTSAIIDTGIGMGSAYIGSKFSGISSRIFKDVSSPILRNVLISGTSNVASGFVVSGGASYIMNGDVDQALKDGVKGAGYGLALGSALGVVQGFQYAKEYDVNPWTGKDLQIEQFARENEFYSDHKGMIYSKTMEKYLSQMENETLDLNKIGGAGFKYQNKIIFSEGHHRMNAAIKYYYKTGDRTYIDAIIKNGNFGEVKTPPFYYPFKNIKKIEL